MTAAELRAVLADVPDDAAVYVNIDADLPLRVVTDAEALDGPLWGWSGQPVVILIQAIRNERRP
jgi:hypothetical protein